MTSDFHAPITQSNIIHVTVFFIYFEQKPWVGLLRIYLVVSDLLQDYYSYTEGRPKLDSHQDWRLLFGYENETHTVLTVARLLNTCDERDYVITVRGKKKTICCFREKRSSSKIRNKFSNFSLK